MNLHRPIGITETKKGLSLSVADLLRKTSQQNLDSLKLNSKLKDMFEQGLTEVQEDKLLDFVPLQMSSLRDLTDYETATNEARAYIREQYEAWQASKAAAERARARAVAYARAAAAPHQAAPQPSQDVSNNSPRYDEQRFDVPRKPRQMDV